MVINRMEPRLAFPLLRWTLVPIAHSRHRHDFLQDGGKRRNKTQSFLSREFKVSRGPRLAISEMTTSRQRFEFRTSLRFHTHHG